MVPAPSVLLSEQNLFNAGLSLIDSLGGLGRHQLFFSPSFLHRLTYLFSAHNRSLICHAGMRKPRAEDIQRAVWKMSKKVPRGADEGASTIPPTPKRLRIGEAAPSVLKKPRTDKGILGSSERGALAMLGERGKASLTEGLVDLTASPSFHPGRAEVDQGAPARPSAMAGPSDPGLS